MSGRKFFRTLVTIEILSEGPIDSPSLDNINSEITDGDWSGKITYGESVEVSGLAMADLLRAQGSDPEFFQIDKLGNDLEG